MQPSSICKKITTTMKPFLVRCLLFSVAPSLVLSFLSNSPTIASLGNIHSFRYDESSSSSSSSSSSTPSPQTMKMVATPFGDLLSQKNNPLVALNQRRITVAEKFIEAWNENRITEAMELIDDDVEFEDASFPGPFAGKDDLERTLRLSSEIPTRNRIVVEDVANDETTKKVGIRFHTKTADGSFDKKGAAAFTLNPESGLIQKVFLVQESNKSGEANLTLLRRATTFADFFKSKGDTEIAPDTDTDISMTAATTTISKSNPMSWFFPQKSESTTSSLTLPETYFAAWNERDMAKACSVFSDSIEYDDTAFPTPFEGKEALEKHLNICAASFPSTFQFQVDDQIIGNDDKTLVRWHVESQGEELFFTRGCSFYKIQAGKIIQGIDFVEPAVFKTGGLSLAARSMASKVSQEPIRLLPLATWITYMYVVFFSDWFYGLPATALEQRTWEEVRDLSLNFFLVSPILHLPFAPVVHPMLEGVFNLLLSWAALFAGFLSDDRAKKPNLLPMVPTVAGMQFLTSAFLLPYLATRSNEPEAEEDGIPVYLDDLGQVAQVTESHLLAPFLTVVGSGSILWGLFARTSDFGGLDERLSSFLQLLSIDRVGSSFLVDLAIFAAFQGWFVDDDLKRRGMDSSSPLGTAAKFVPFFGMAAYLTFRDSLPSKEEIPI